MEEFEKIDISDVIDELPISKKQLAVERAMRKLDVDFEEIDDDNEEHMQVICDELVTVALGEMVASLQQRGLVEVTGVTEDGELKYSVTEEGKKALEDNTI